MNSQIKAPNNRFDWIDRIKGIAILGIVIFHFFQNYPNITPLISTLDRNGAKVGYACVDIFFVMAGFNVTYAIVSKLRKNKIKEFKNNWKSWLTKRLIRLYPAYLLAVVLSCLLYFLFTKLTIKSPIYFALSCVGLAGKHFQSINPGFWFFTVVLEAYILTPLMFVFLHNKPNNILVLGIIGGTITKIISFILLLNSYNDLYLFFLQNNFLGSYLFQFCLGLYWGFIYAENNKFRRVDFIMSIGIFCLGMIFYLALEISKIDIVFMLGFDMMFTPLFFIGLQLLLSHLNKISQVQRFLQILSILGIYSYQIYLIHQPLYFILFPKVKNIFNYDSNLKILIVLTLTGLILIVYSLFFIRIEELVTKKIGGFINKYNLRKTSNS